MDLPAPPLDTRPPRRIEVLFDELAELTGQRNAIDGRIVDIVAEIDRDDLAGQTGARSIAALVAWKTGCSPRNAATIAAVAHRSEEFPICAEGMREGRFSLDQVGVIAERAADGSDAHYAELAGVATVEQLRHAVKLAPRPDKERPEQRPSISRSRDAEFDLWRIRLRHSESATFEAALQSHRDALIAQWKRDHGDAAEQQSGDTAQLPGDTAERPPLPTTLDAFLQLVEDGWDVEVARRPHGHRTTVVVHLDVDRKVADLHLGPILSDGDRQYLTCDATCETWFEKSGEPLGAGRTTRTINRRLRRALEHRHPTCAVPGCGATQGLHAHHIIHWENGGPTELGNLVLLCPYHHRLHHRGEITISGPPDALIVTDSDGDPMHPGSLARKPTTPPPTVAPCQGPTGERAQWWWYEPFQPQPPPSTN